MRVSTRTQARTVVVDEPLTRTRVDVKRVRVNRGVDTKPETRHEGDTIIIPVVEEIVCGRTESPHGRLGKKRIAMAKTVVAIFDTRAEAERASEMLVEAGFDRADIDVHAGDWAESETRESGSWWAWLFGESDERTAYREGSRAGALLSVTTVSDGAAERARELLVGVADDVEMDEVEIDDAEMEETPEVTGAARSEEEVVPVVEEGLKVGKRPVARGGVRVYARELEQPVEEQIRLREERVRVERRPVDRPATAADVRVDEGAYGRHESDFRAHAATLGGGPYEEYRDAYRAGYEMGADQRYAGREWSAVESDVHADWERRRPGTWERFKDSLRYAWDRARGARRAA